MISCYFKIRQHKTDPSTCLNSCQSMSGVGKWLTKKYELEMEIAFLTNQSAYNMIWTRQRAYTFLVRKNKENNTLLQKHDFNK